MSAHVCHAACCRRRVPPAMLMCAPHWRMVPADLQQAVQAAYRPGQERLDPRPSQAYLAAHKQAVNAVAAREGRRVPYPQEAAEAGRPGELDPVIRAALDAGGRALAHAERVAVDGRHAHDGHRGEVCPGCRFPFRAGAPRCPSRVYLVSGLRAALATVPAAAVTRQCRQCHGPVPVPAGAAGAARGPDNRPLCDSCSFQPDLFGGM